MVGQGAWRISNGPCTPCDGKHSNLISRICFHTRVHTFTHIHMDEEPVLCYLWVFLCVLVYKNPPMGWSLLLRRLSIIQLLLSVCLFPPLSSILPYAYPCFSTSCPLVEACWWGTPAMAHSPPPYGTDPQDPLPSSSPASFPHPSCRGERRAAPSGHHRSPQ